MSEPLDLEPIRRRLPNIPREQMSRHEEDRADLLAEVERLRAELARRDEQITAVRETHWRVQLLPAGNRDPELTCGECGGDWPCPTIEALDGTA